jgi:hypothetical protein
MGKAIELAFGGTRYGARWRIAKARGSAQPKLSTVNAGSCWP